jgi:hypothetical protein
MGPVPISSHHSVIWSHFFSNRVLLPFVVGIVEEKLYENLSLALNPKMGKNR